MKAVTVLCTCSLLLTIIVSSSLTDMDYTIGGSRNGKGKAEVSQEASFHGSHSLRLSVVAEKGKYARIYANFDRPMPVEDLDQLSIWIKPALGLGNVTLDIYFYGGGKLGTLHSWSDGDLGQWKKLDAFQLSYDLGGKGPIKGLRDWQEDLQGKSIEKIWIRLYNASNISTTAYLDYLQVGRHVISFEPLEKEELLSAPKSVAPGEKIAYVITYGNFLEEPIDLVVVEQYDPGIVFLWADPLPDRGTNNMWTIRALPPGSFGQITIAAKTSKLACKAEIDGSVSGKGYASVSRTLSTDQPEHQITNRVTISSPKFILRAQATTAVKPVTGSISAFSEHGAGSYSSKEWLTYSPAKISVIQDMQAERSFTSVNLSGRPLRFNSSWYADRICENRVTKSSLSESYLNTKYLNVSSEAGIHSAGSVSRKETWMESESDFLGIAEYDFLSKTNALHEMFLGSFETKNKRIEWHNSSKKYPDKEWLNCCFANLSSQNSELIQEDDE